MKAKPVEKGPWSNTDRLKEFRARRPWLAICEACPELEDLRKLGGRCRIFAAMDQYKGCGCGGRVENIIGLRETRCPLGKFEAERID